MNSKLRSIMNTYTPKIICFGCSYTNIGSGAESSVRNIDDWPKYLALLYPNYHVINLAVGGSSLQHAILRASKFQNCFPKDEYNYKIIIQITGRCRYVPFKDSEHDQIFDEEIISVTENYTKTGLNLEGNTQKFTLGAIKTRYWKKHWWVKNYLTEYSDYYIEQDFLGNVLIAEKISDFAFFWQDWEKKLFKKKFNFEFDNYAVEELGGRSFVSKNYCADKFYHFKTRGAKAVANWIKKKTKWK